MQNIKEDNIISSYTNIFKSVNLSDKSLYETKSVFKKTQIMNAISFNPKIALSTFRDTIKIGSKPDFSNKELRFDYQKILALKNRSLLNALIFLFSIFAIINCVVPLIYSIVLQQATNKSILFSVFVSVTVLATNLGVYCLLKKFIYNDYKFKKWLIYQNHTAIFFCFFCTLGELAILGLISKNDWFHNSKIGYFWGYLLYPFLFISFLKLLNSLLVKILVFWINQSIISIFLLFADPDLEFYDYITLYAYSFIHFLFGTLVLYINEFEAKETLEFFANFKKANHDWQKLADMIPHSVMLFCPFSNELLFCNYCGNQILDSCFSKNDNNKIDQLSSCLGSLKKIKVSSQYIFQNLEEMLKMNENKDVKPTISTQNEDKKTAILPDLGNLTEILRQANENSNLYSEMDTIIYATKSKVRLNQKYVGFSESNERDFTVKLKFITYENKLSVLLILEDCTYVEVISELHETSKFKNKLLSSFSHELKTPLNGAIPILESLEKESQLDLHVLKLLSVSIASLKILQTVLDDIIDYALINSGELQLNCTETNLIELMNEITSDISVQTQEKLIKIKLMIDPNVPSTLFTDYKRLRQILMNLIRNSIKFSFVKGEISIKIAIDSSSILIFTIEDIGIGISCTQLKILQKLLWDLKNNEKMLNSCKEDFSLGLVISQNLAMILGPLDGTEGIQISSDGEGKGTKVEFRIENKIKYSQSDGYYSTFNRIKSQIKFSKNLNKNVIRPNKKMTWFRRLEMMKLDDSLYESRSLNSIRIEEEQFSTSREHTNDINSLVQRFDFKTTTLTQRTLNDRQFPRCSCEPILVVDDDSFNLLSAKVIFEKIGFKVQTAFNGIEAIEKVVDKCKNKCAISCSGFKLIVMDYSMPVMNGIEATKKLIEMMNAGEINKIPVVACTAFGAKEDIINCFEAGMVDYISKPIQRAMLEKVIKDWIK